MGNHESQMIESTETLENHITHLENQIVSIESAYQNHYSWPNVDSDLKIHGVSIKCHKSKSGGDLTSVLFLMYETIDVRMILGPVIGKVTSDSVLFLIETNVDATIRCYLSQADEHCPQGRLVQQQKITTKHHKPIQVQFHQLLPGMKYLICFGGVCKEDAQGRVGHFRTFQSLSPQLRMIVVSGDNPMDLKSGEKNLWPDVYQRIQDPDEPVDVILHLGQQVALQHAFQEAWTILLRHATSKEKSHLLDQGWAHLEAKVYERIQQAYYFQWNLPCVRECLAQASNLMIWSDLDIYPEFTLDPEFRVDMANPTIQMHVIRSMFRLARRGYHEYQRQLWDLNVEDIYAREAPFVAMALRCFELSSELPPLRAQMQLSQDAMISARKQTDFQLAKAHETKWELLKKNLMEIQVQIEANVPDLHNDRGEEYAQVWENIGLLMIDMRGNQVFVDGTQAADNPILNAKQWQFYEQVLTKNGVFDTVNVLVIASELPLIDQNESKTREWIARSASFESLRHWWSNSPDAQLRLLTLIMDWKVAKPSREVVFLAGGLGRGLSTELQDSEMHMTINQYVVGPLTAALKHEETFPLSRDCHETLSERYEVQHHVREVERNFGQLAINSGNTRALQMNFSVVGQYVIPTHMTLGPVLGQVTSTSISILVEVDTPTTVSCVVRNTLSSEVHVIHQSFRQAHVPGTYVFTQLKPSQQYEVAFQGIACPETRRGSFHTLGKIPKRVGLAFVCRDEPAALRNDVSLEGEGAQEHALWASLVQSLTSPFSSVDAVVHLGGQVEIEHSCGWLEAKAHLNAGRLVHARAQASAFDQSSSHVTADARSRAKESIRGVYRYHWNLPHIREALAHGSHVMIRTHGHQNATKDANVDSILHTLIDEVYEEYQLALLLPEARRNLDHWSCTWSNVALFALNGKRRRSSGLSNPRDPFLTQEQWTDLNDVLSNVALEHLVVASTYPFVDDSMDDAQLKSKFGHESVELKFPYHGLELLRFLKALETWQQHSGSNRRVTLVSGSDSYGLTSVLENHASQMRLRQYVVGPIHAPRIVEDFELAGALSKSSWTYRHADIQHACHYLYLQVMTQEIQVIVSDVQGTTTNQHAHVVSSESFASQSPFVPEWLTSLQDTTMMEERSSSNETIQTCVKKHRETLRLKVNPDYYEEDLWRFSRRLTRALEEFYDKELDEHEQHELLRPCLYMVHELVHHNGMFQPVAWLRAPVKEQHQLVEQLTTECFVQSRALSEAIANLEEEQWVRPQPDSTEPIATWSNEDVDNVPKEEPLDHSAKHPEIPDVEPVKEQLGRANVPQVNEIVNLEEEEPKPDSTELIATSSNEDAGNFPKEEPLVHSAKHPEILDMESVEEQLDGANVSEVNREGLDQENEDVVTPASTE